MFEKLSWRVTGFIVIFSKDDIKFSRCFLFFFWFAVSSTEFSVNEKVLFFLF